MRDKLDIIGKEIPTKISLVISLEDGDAENKEYEVHINGVIGEFRLDATEELDTFIYDDLIYNLLGYHKDRVENGECDDLNFNTGFYDVIVSFRLCAIGGGITENEFKIEEYHWREAV